MVVIMNPKPNKYLPQPSHRVEADSTSQHLRKARVVHHQNEDYHRDVNQYISRRILSEIWLCKVVGTLQNQIGVLM